MRPIVKIHSSKTGNVVAVLSDCSDDGTLVEHFIEHQFKDGPWTIATAKTPTTKHRDVKSHSFELREAGKFEFRVTTVDLSDAKRKNTSHFPVMTVYFGEEEIPVETPPPVEQPPIDNTPPPPPPPPPAPGDWSPVAIAFDSALGPRCSTPNDGPLNFQPESKPTMAGNANRINPYELGPDSGPGEIDDYWAVSGQIGQKPEAITNPGLDRHQAHAYDRKVFAISPRLDYSSGQARPDRTVHDYDLHKGDHPIAMVRNQAQLSNEALVLWSNGLIGAAGTQTSRKEGDKWPQFRFMAEYKPTCMALTSGNEFLLVGLYNERLDVGQIAVFALEAKNLEFHTWPHIGMQNQGCWSDIVWLGNINLPFKHPTSIAAASNGSWVGPNQTGDLVLGGGPRDTPDGSRRLDEHGYLALGLDLRNPSIRKGLLSTEEANWGSVVANMGYFIVASKTENQVSFFDMRALFAHFRKAYLEDFDATIAARAAGSFPPWIGDPSPNGSDIAPKLVRTDSWVRPTAVLAGHQLERWSFDYFKAFVLTEDGTVSWYDTSSFMARWSWETAKGGPLQVKGQFQMSPDCNPVSMCFARNNEYPITDAPRHMINGVDVPDAADPINGIIWIACRGDRTLRQVATFHDRGFVHRQIKDRRLLDPVHVWVDRRGLSNSGGYILSVCDFAGRKLHQFRIGSCADVSGRVYHVGGNDFFEYAGAMGTDGFPFVSTSANVN